jgi:hypothetical protein
MGSVQTPVQSLGGTADGVVPPGIPMSLGRQPLMEGPYDTTQWLLPSQLLSPGGPVTVFGGAREDTGGTTVDEYVGAPLRGAVNVTVATPDGGMIL